MLGRSPDHVGSSLAGMYMGLKAFEKHGSARAKALGDYFHYARDNDLYLSYVIINPQADRSKAASNQPGEDLVARIVDEDSTGVTIRGAKMQFGPRACRNCKREFNRNAGKRRADCAPPLIASVSRHVPSLTGFVLTCRWGRLRSR